MTPDASHRLLDLADEPGLEPRAGLNAGAVQQVWQQVWQQPGRLRMHLMNLPNPLLEQKP